VADYIAFKIERAGGQLEKLVSPEALQLISASVRWPQEINRLMSDLLDAAIKIDQLPIPKDLALKQCGQMSSLAVLKMLAGVKNPEIRSFLWTEKKIKVDPSALKRLFLGAEVQVAGLKEAVREYLLPLSDGRAALTPALTRLAPAQQTRMSEILVLLAEFKFAFDWERLAEDAGLQAERLYAILFRAQDPTETEVAAIYREVKRTANEKKRRASKAA